MYVKPRSYLTAGIAVLGVGAIALTPVQPVASQVALAPQRVISDLGVELAAAVDPIQAWVDFFETTATNIEILGKFYMQKPFPLLQTIAANTATYAEEAANGNAGVIPEQIWGNIQTFFQAPWSPGGTAEFGPPPDLPDGGVAEVPAGTYLSKTIPTRPEPDLSLNPPSVPQSPKELNDTLLLFTVGLSLTASPEDGTDELWEQIVSLSPIWRFLNTPYSGQVLGLLGPLVSPIVELGKSVNAIVQDLSRRPNPDLQNALFELINIPANMTNAFFNGTGFWDLTDLIGNFIDIPESFDGVRLGLNMGGLLNAVPVDGNLNDPDNPPTKWSSGVGFDSIAIPSGDPDTGIGFLINNNPIPGLPNSWFGNAIGLGQFLAEQLLVTPVDPPTAAAEPAAAKEAAPLDIPAPAVTEAPADEAAPVVDTPAEEPAAAVVTEVEEAVTEPAVEDSSEVGADVEASVEAAVEAVEAPASEPAESAAPAAADSGPEAAAADSDQSDANTGRAARNTQRGAS